MADAERDEQTERDERGPLRAELVPELLEAGSDARLRRPERQVELGRDLLVREVVEERQVERLALQRR